jgi:RNA polymerase sigma-70 factor, ECF subfamily
LRSGGVRPAGRVRLSMNQAEPILETEAIWREFHERLRAFISRRVPRPADVEDILQEVFIRIYRSVDSLHNRERLASWLFQITRNAIVDHLRAGSSQVALQTDDFDPPAPDEGDDGSEASELARCIEPMIAALPENYREAIQLTDINGFTQLEAAQRSGLTFSGMKSRVQRARRQLKDMLLDCCRIELDSRGGIRDYVLRDVSRFPCGPCGRDK